MLYEFLMICYMLWLIVHTDADQRLAVYLTTEQNAISELSTLEKNSQPRFPHPSLVRLRSLGTFYRRAHELTKPTPPLPRHCVALVATEGYRL